MKAEALSGLASRIRQELKDLERVLDRINEGWQRARRSDDDYYLDSVALNLHGFYSGLERIFALIAENIDNSLPQGENWHFLLLQQMSQENSPLRPAVISEEVGKRMNEYRGFRHVVRNVYTYRFDPIKIENLVKSAPDLFAQLKAELLAFAAFLEQ
ncbi:MAG: hypothetical protein AB8I58_03250 [Anaerolineales bacterium]